MTTRKTVTQTTSHRTKELVYTAIFAVLIAVCSWVAIPSTVPFTMQTFGVFLALMLLGGRCGTQAVLVYLLLGAVGVPVFAEFTGGLGILFGSTGGYLVGFLAMTCLYWLVMKHPKDHPVLEVVTLVVGLALCYAFGTIWFVQVYSANVGEIGYGTALGWCVIPYIVPDLVKLGLALALRRRLQRHVSL